MGEGIDALGWEKEVGFGDCSLSQVGNVPVCQRGLKEPHVILLAGLVEKPDNRNEYDPQEY